MFHVQGEQKSILTKACEKVLTDSTKTRLIPCKNSYERYLVHKLAKEMKLIHVTVETGRMKRTLTEKARKEARRLKAEVQQDPQDDYYKKQYLEIFTLEKSWTVVPVKAVWLLHPFNPSLLKRMAEVHVTK